MKSGLLIPIVGLPEKNPKGISEKPILCTDMIGHSSGLTTCVMPATYHNTTSLFPISLFCFVHSGKPSYTLLLAGYFPAGYSSSSIYCVTQNWWFRNPAFFNNSECGDTNGLACAP